MPFFTLSIEIARTVVLSQVNPAAIWDLAVNQRSELGI
jgi:hypothetical protein